MQKRPNPVNKVDVKRKTTVESRIFMNKVDNKKIKYPTLQSESYNKVNTNELEISDQSGWMPD